MAWTNPLRLEIQKPRQPDFAAAIVQNRCNDLLSDTAAPADTELGIPLIAAAAKMRITTRKRPGESFLPAFPCRKKLAALRLPPAAVWPPGPPVSLLETSKIFFAPNARTAELPVLVPPTEHVRKQ